MPLNFHASVIDAVFFDLDGTLVDSAADLVAAMDRLRRDRGEAPVDALAVSAVVSKGGRAMLRRGFIGADESMIETLLPAFLEIYAQAISTHTRTYPGVDDLLLKLDARDVRWGIVTNKPGHLARAVVAALALDARCAALVSGDCLPTRKPDPETLLHACALAGVEPSRCVYVGDDARDIQAGRRAGMLTIAAAWGYLDGEDPRHWGATLVAAAPRDLIAAFGLD